MIENFGQGSKQGKEGLSEAERRLIEGAQVHLMTISTQITRVERYISEYAREGGTPPDHTSSIKGDDCFFSTKLSVLSALGIIVNRAFLVSGR